MRLSEVESADRARRELAHVRHARQYCQGPITVCILQITKGGDKEFVTIPIVQAQMVLQHLESTLLTELRELGVDV